MRIAALHLTDILRRLTTEGTHVAIVGDRRFLIIAGTDADEPDHAAYAVGVPIDESNAPSGNRLVTLTRTGECPVRTWRTSPPINHGLGLGDIMAMAESVYGKPGWTCLRRCIDTVLGSAWHLGVQPSMEYIQRFMDGAITSGDLVRHASTEQLRYFEAWLCNPNPQTVQFQLALALTARLTERIETRNRKREHVAA